MSDVNIAISNEIITPIIEKKIQLALLEAMGNKDLIIQKMIEKILTTKVDDSGKVNEYSSYNKHDFIDVAFRKTIAAASQKAVNEYIETCVPQIQAEFLRQLKSKKGSAAFVTSLLGSLNSAAQNSYKFKTEVHIEDTSNR